MKELNAIAVVFTMFYVTLLQGLLRSQRRVICDRYVINTAFQHGVQKSKRRASCGSFLYGKKKTVATDVFA